MDVEMLTTIIGNVGFPVAAFCLMWWMCNDTLRGVQSALNELAKSIEVLKDDIRGVSNDA